MKQNRYQLYKKYCHVNKTYTTGSLEVMKGFHAKLTMIVKDGLSVDLTILADTHVMGVLDVVVVMESRAIAKREKEAVTLTMNVRAPLYVALATVHG